jgi:uncharacterized membrane protein YjjB (DUF3815 family)
MRHRRRCCSPRWPARRALGSFVLLSMVGLGPEAASGGAAIVVGVAAGLLRRRGRVPLGSVPPLVVALAGIVPLLPGLTAYRGFYQLAVEGVADGLVTVTLALASRLALAAGVALGQYLVRPNAIPLSSLPPPAACGAGIGSGLWRGRRTSWWWPTGCPSTA